MPTSKIELDIIEICDIPTLMMVPVSAVACPVVFFLHALGRKKEDAMELGLLLAQRGIACIAPDARMHGARFDPGLEEASREPNAVYPPESRLDEFHLMMSEIIPGNHRDMETILDELASDARIDRSRVGVTGVSMGGISSYYIAAHSSRILAAAPVLGWPDFEERWRQAELESFTYPTWTERMEAARPVSEEFQSWMRSVDPLPKLYNGLTGSLFIQLGDLDPHVPKSTAVRLYHDLKDRYAMQPGRLRLRIYDGIGHQATPEMFADSAAWFEEQFASALTAGPGGRIVTNS